MRALISGQAGFAVLLDGDAATVLRLEDPDHALPCQATDLVWLLADAQDLVEYNEIDRSQVLNRLSLAWKQDRALQIVLMLVDRTLTIELRQRAAILLDPAIENQDIADFLANRLYAAPLPHDLDGIDFTGLTASGKLCIFLDDLRVHQDAISASRGAWNSLRPRLFVDLIRFQNRDRSRTEMALKAKEAVERALVNAGIFRLMAHSLHAGTSPFSSGEVLAVLQDKRLLAYQAVLKTVLTDWVEACGPLAQALLRVALLGVVSSLRLKKFALVLMDWLGDNARGQSHWDLLRDAAVRTLAEHKQPDQDFETNLQRALGDIASEWFKGARQDSSEPREQGDIFAALGSLSEYEMLRLKRFAKWRVRGLGRKALGRDADDLLNEAIAATATGERVWNQQVDLYSHLLGAMRSISSSWRERKGEEYLESELTPPGGKGPFDESATSLDPERIFEAKEILEQVRNLFADDSSASNVLDLLAEGHSAKEIQALLAISPKGFDAVTKRIRRKLDSWQGWEGAA